MTDPTQRLFLDIDQALTSDYRLSNLPQIRAQLTSILTKVGLPQEIQSGLVPPGQIQARNGVNGRPEQIYADDNDLTPPARADAANYRLPPLSFDQTGGGPSPHLSDHSIPRSLSPITERTDPSRNNSQRTTMTDRKVSESSSRQPTGSGSSKYPLQEGGLETITDTNSLSHVTEEPRQTSPMPVISQSNTPRPTGTNGQIVRSPDEELPLVSARSQTTFESLAQTGDESLARTGDSIYSQNTTPARSVPPSPAAPLSMTKTSVPPIVTAPVVPAAPITSVLAEANDTQSSEPPLAPPIGIGRPAPSSIASEDSERSIHSPTPRRVASTEFKKDKFVEQPTAQYLMNVVEEPTSSTPPLPPTATSSASTEREKPRPTIITDFTKPMPSSTAPAMAGSSGLVAATGPAAKTHESLGRKPSGARAPPPKKLSGRSSTLGSVDDNEIPPVPSLPGQSNTGHGQDTSGISEDIGEDASAYMAYADQPPSATYAQSQTAPLAVNPKVVEEGQRSSFAPSKAAADRRAKAEAAAAEAERVKNVPGGGKRAVSGIGGPGAKIQATGAGKTWSDDEDEDDEDEDGDDVSPVVQRSGGRVGENGNSSGIGEMGGRNSGYGEEQQYSAGNAGQNNGSIGRSAGLRALPPVPQSQPQPQIRDRHSPQPQQYRQSAYTPNGGGNEEFQQPLYYPERPNSRSPNPNQDRYSQQPQQQSLPRGQSQMNISNITSGPIPNNAPPASRQSIWNANFSAGHGMPSDPRSSKFVELEAPQAKLIQAFAPHGLLQAGMQDKEDRSAKKQEELAREMGSSLVNVPSKPPPPSAGLLGAVAQHEKERRNAGGIGATLTDREREKRLAVSVVVFLVFGTKKGFEANRIYRKIDRGRLRNYRDSKLNI